MYLPRSNESLPRRLYCGLDFCGLSLHTVGRQCFREAENGDKPAVSGHVRCEGLGTQERIRQRNLSQR